MQPIEIRKDIYWVGAIDWNIRDFHGYSTPKGTTYNAYLMMDDKITLFDTVKGPFSRELIRRIAGIVDPRQIDYLVVNHVEMDHSGSLPELVEMIRPEKIFCSSMGKAALLEHFHRDDWPYQVVESGQILDLGRRSVQFLETKMLHWPDSMFSYIPEERLLISSDAFGQHWGTSERFDDEVDMGELFSHAAKYYANILLLFSPLVRKLLATVGDMGLDIDMIAPDHGLIWRGNPSRIIESYDSWSRQECGRKAVVVYDTMWNSTAAMASAIGEGLMDEGVSVKIMDLRVSHRSDVMMEMLDAAAFVPGSSTLNNGMLPRMADMLCYMKGLRPVNRIGTAFGSYGWSGEAVKLITRGLEEMKVQVVDPGLRMKFVPTRDDLDQCVEFGRRIGKSIRELKG